MTNDDSLDALKQELLAMLLEEAEQAAPAPAAAAPVLKAAPRNDSMPLSFSQQRMWFLQQFDPHSALYNLPFALRLNGRLDVAALQRALTEIVRRHESLRCRFRIVGDGPVQRIAPAGALALPVTDLTAVALDEREQRAFALAAQEAATPFRLEDDSPIRAALLRLDEHDYIFTLTLHHIVADGWSIGVLVREVATLYCAYVQGAPSPLPELAIQYPDFAIWQREWFSGAGHKAQLSYWCRQLADAPPLLRLPLARPRPPQMSYRGAHVGVDVPASVLHALRNVAQENHATLFMVLNAAFSLLLSRYSGQDDICVGTAVANRNDTNTEALIGVFINTLVLRTRIDPHAGFAALLAQVRNCTLDAYAHQDLPFEQLVDAMKLERSLSHTPLFQAMLLLENEAAGSIELPGLTMSQVPGDKGVAKFDLTLTVSEQGEGLGCDFNYATDLFDGALMARMATHFARLLEAIAYAPGTPVGALQMLDSRELRQLMQLAQAFEVPVAADAPFGELFARQAALQPSVVALEAGSRQMSYAELDVRSNQLAHLLAEQGAAVGQLVGLHAERGIDLVVGLLAILKAGAAYLPLDPSYPQERLAYMLADAQPAAVLSTSALQLPALAVPLIAFDNPALAAAQPTHLPLPAGLTQDALAYVIYTSGSTGKPKGVMVQQRALLNLWQALKLAALGRHAAGARVALNASVSFDASLQALVQLLSGHTVVLVPGAIRADGAAMLAFLEQGSIDVFDCTPAQLELMLAAGLDRSPRPRTVLVGGEALSMATWSALRQAERLDCFNVYGPTECTVDATFARLATAGAQPTLGRPLAGSRVYLLDASLNPVPLGAPGELYIGGAGVARGYLKRPELTAERFLPDPFGEPGERIYRSGDVARYLADGQLEFLGRADGQVKLRGYRIELGEIETVLAAQEQVLDACVLVREDVPGDQRLVAYFTGTAQAAELREQLLRSLPGYMVPAHFVMLAALPLTPNGKIDRRVLPLPEAGVTDTYVAPVSAEQELAAAIWREVLRVERVGIDDNFFALGGHSLLAVAIVERMRVAGLHTSVRSLFSTPTIGGLCASLASDPSERAAPPNLIPAGCTAITPEMLPLVALTPAQIAAIAAGVPGGAANIGDIYPLAPLQQGILFHHLMQEQGDTYLIPLMLSFAERDQMDAFLAALQTTVDRHDILRSAMAWDGLDEPVQVVWRSAPVQIEQLDCDRDAFADYCSQERLRLDIRQAPLLRAFSAPQSDGSWLLCVAAHHLVSDHTTLELLVQEIGLVLQGRGAELAPALPFREFVAQTRLGVSEAEHEAFFRSMLGGLDQPTAPFGLLDVHASGAGTDEVHSMLDAALAARVRNLARRLNVSAASMMHLAWAKVLGATVGQPRVAFGTVMLGRMHGGGGQDRALGMFINTLPLCVQLEGHSAGQALAATHAALAGLMKHEHASLALAQRCSGVLPPLPLFSTLLNYRHSAPADEPAPDQAAAFEGMELTSSQEPTNYPVVMAVDDLGQGFRLTAQTKGVPAQRMCDYMVAALEALTAALEKAPQTPVDQLNVLPASERELLLDAFSRGQQSIDGACEATFGELFARQAALQPSMAALESDSQQLSYAELDVRSNQMAHLLAGEGVGVGQLVGLHAERGIDLVVGLLAILKAGAAYLPLDPSYPPERLAYMLGDAQPAAVLSSSGMQLPALAVPLIALGDLALTAAQPTHLPLPAGLTQDALAYVIYTSGSTGKPKGVMVHQRALLNLWQALDLAALAHHAAGARVALNASVSFDASLQALVQLLSGHTVVLVPGAIRADGAAMLAFLEQRSIDIFDCTPAQLELMLAAGLDRSQRRRTVLVGGEALSVATWSTLRQAESLDCYNVYGPTECTVDATFARLSTAGAQPNLGRPLAGSRVYLLDANLNPVPLGAPGELYIGGVGVARGYLKRPDLTAERFLPDPFGGPGERIYRSGDMARYLADGQLEFLGRADNQVKLRGYRIELGEIEAVLAAQELVLDACVLVREDVPGDQRLVAYFTGTAPAEALRTQLLRSLPGYMVPAHFVALDALPLTPNGKLDRAALPAPEHGASAYVAPVDDAQRTIAAIWAEVLRIDQVGIDANFFALGGHSLLATQVISRIRNAFGVELPLRALFEAPTLAALALRIDGAAAIAAPPVLPVGRDGPLALSFGQQRLWFLDLLEPGQATYHIPLAVRLGGPLDVAALGGALDEIVRRHEVLRTSYASVEGEPVQVIGAGVALDMPLTDLSELPHAEREARALWLAQDEIARGFDLGSAPLLRAHLMRLEAEQHIIVLTVHHIVSDGWSMGILMREIGTLYSAFAQGLPSPLAELPIQYADYAQWQRAWLRGAVLERQLDYWRKRLAGAPALLALPTDRPRPAQQTYRGAAHGVWLSEALTARLRALGNAAQASLFMTMQAAFSILLSRYTGQDDICIGTPIANRERGETENLIGFFANTLVLRAQVERGASFAGLLAQVRLDALDAYSHQELPFEQLVEALQPERQLSHSPLFQVMLVVGSPAGDSIEVPGLSLEQLGADSTVAKFDLTLNVEDLGSQLRAGFEYNVDLFDADTIAGLGRHFAALLESIVAAPESRIGDLAMLAPAERERVLHCWNDSAHDVSDVVGNAMSVQQMFEQQVLRTPHAVALVSEESELTYAELNAQANRLAHHLRSLGVGPDILVGICAARAPSLVVAVLATLKAGGAYLPLDPSYPAERLAYMLADAAPAVLLTQQALEGQFGGLGVTTVCADAQFAGLDTNLPSLTLPDHLAYVIYTSGSTGRPKGTAVRQAGLANLLAWFIGQFGLNAQDKVLLISSFSFDLTQKNIFGPLAVGGQLHLPAEGYVPEHLHARILAQQISIVNCAPSAFYPLLECHPAHAPWPLRQVFLGGEPINGALLQQAFAHCDPAPLFHNTYGPTEASDVVSFHTFALADANEIIPIGAPVWNTQLYVLDADFNLVAPGVAGQLFVAGTGLGRGYLRRPDLTAEKFVPNPFAAEPGQRMYATGDLARQRADGQVEYLGRIDNQVKIRGFRIELGEIEAALEALPQVREAAVLAVESQSGEKRLVAYVVGAEGADCGSAALRTALLAFLPEFMLPSQVVVLGAMPLNPNGKVDRKALPEPGRERDLANFVAPASASEIAVAAIWCAALELDQVGVHEDFFSAGGHSLLAVRVLSAIARDLNVTIPLDVVFRSRTVALLAQYIDEVNFSRLSTITTDEAPAGFARIRI